MMSKTYEIDENDTDISKAIISDLVENAREWSIDFIESKDGVLKACLCRYIRGDYIAITQIAKYDLIIQYNIGCEALSPSLDYLRVIHPEEITLRHNEKNKLVEFLTKTMYLQEIVRQKETAKRLGLINLLKETK